MEYETIAIHTYLNQRQGCIVPRAARKSLRGEGNREWKRN